MKKKFSKNSKQESKLIEESKDMNKITFSSKYISQVKQDGKYAIIYQQHNVDMSSDYDWSGASENSQRHCPEEQNSIN